MVKELLALAAYTAGPAPGPLPGTATTPRSQFSEYLCNDLEMSPIDFECRGHACLNLGQSAKTSFHQSGGKTWAPSTTY